ncbi:tRNA pseudouridine(38-40) synthase TruA [bacterium]|nr:tRNA pseudouridine(38-40) synthase TruA [bacterium]
MRVRLDLAYVGARYVGWQRQSKGVSIQAVVEDALSKLYDRRIQITGAGRTDAGVHAAGQVAHFDVQKTRPAVRDLPRILNGLLPADISVLGARRVSKKFDARNSAGAREYLYRILVSPIPDPFRAPLVWHCPKAARITPENLRRIAGTLRGTKDFSVFTIRRARKMNTTRTLKHVVIQRTRDELRIRFVADAFLHRMVRRMVAYLVETALGSARREPLYAAPASGLCLMKVYY